MSSLTRTWHRWADPTLTRRRSLALFSCCSRRELQRTASLGTEVDVPAGHVLLREGEPGNQFVVVEEGAVALSAGGRALGELGPGSFVGERSILDCGLVPTTVTTTAPTLVLVLTRGEFLDLLRTAPSIARRLLVADGERATVPADRIRAREVEPALTPQMSVRAS